MIAHINQSVIVEESENGETGLANLEHQADQNLKTVVLLDINMPVLDGWEFLEQIQKSNFYHLAELEIYMVSSSTDERDILKAKDYDFVKGFIIKPLSKEKIQEILTA